MVQPDWWDEKCMQQNILSIGHSDGIGLLTYPLSMKLTITINSVSKCFVDGKSCTGEKIHWTDLVICRHYPKSFWAKIKQFLSNTSQSDTDSIDSEMWFRYFESLFSHNIENNVGQGIFDHLTREINPDVMNGPVTREEIRKSVISMCNNKATGTGRLCVAMFKATVDIVLLLFRVTIQSHL